MFKSVQSGFMDQASLVDVAQQVGTPTYCYSRKQIEANYGAYADAFAALDDALICFAVKANSNLEVLRILADLGSGADVVSMGELALALEAGVPPSKIVFSGVAKTAEEIRFALGKGIFQINVESEPELHEIMRVAGEMGVVANVALRVNPDITVDTNKKIATGAAETKFGVAWSSVNRLALECKQSSNVMLQGIAVHLGSQILDTTPYAIAFEKVVSLAEELQKNGLNLKTIDIGGGLGIDYTGDTALLPTPANLVNHVEKILSPLGCKIIVEPGRSLLGNAGILLSKVIYEKQGEDRNFLIIDAGMNDLLRPSMYDAFHRVVPVAVDASLPLATYDVVGPVCETGDTFGKQRQLPTMKSGDLLAIMDAGAYGAVMASTYNARPLVKEIIVAGEGYRRVDRG